MSEHREEHIDLCAGYALGSLDEADLERIDQHLAEGCEHCEAALADFSTAHSFMKLPVMDRCITRLLPVSAI